RAARDPFARLGRWCALVCAVLIVVSIGSPLLGRRVFLGVDLLKALPPWSASTPTGFVYRHGPIHDTVDASTPARQVFRDRLLHDHDFALWDSYPSGGTPLASQPGLGVLGPLSWPVVALGVRVGPAWSALARLALAAFGMVLLLRRLRLSRVAAWCGAIAWCT